MANAYEIPGFSFTLEAAADLSAFQFCGVNVNTAGRAAAPAAGGRIAGFLQNKPSALGQTGTIVTDGVTKAKVGTGGVTAGDTVKCLVDGTITTAGAGTYAVGIALQTGVAGTLVALLLTPTGGGGLIA